VSTAYSVSCLRLAFTQSRWSQRGAGDRGDRGDRGEGGEETVLRAAAVADVLDALLLGPFADTRVRNCVS
jgi:hypothetical protein